MPHPPCVPACLNISRWRSAVSPCSRRSSAPCCTSAAEPRNRSCFPPPCASGRGRGAWPSAWTAGGKRQKRRRQVGRQVKEPQTQPHWQRHRRGKKVVFTFSTSSLVALRSCSVFSACCVAFSASAHSLAKRFLVCQTPTINTLSAIKRQQLWFYPWWKQMYALCFCWRRSTRSWGIYMTCRDSRFLGAWSCSLNSAGPSWLQKGAEERRDLRWPAAPRCRTSPSLPPSPPPSLPHPLPHPFALLLQILQVFAELHADARRHVFGHDFALAGVIVELIQDVLERRVVAESAEWTHKIKLILKKTLHKRHAVKEIQWAFNGKATNKVFQWQDAWAECGYCCMYMGLAQSCRCQLA